MLKLTASQVLLLRNRSGRFVTPQQRIHMMAPNGSTARLYPRSRRELVKNKDRRGPLHTTLLNKGRCGAVSPSDTTLCRIMRYMTSNCVLVCSVLVLSSADSCLLSSHVRASRGCCTWYHDIRYQCSVRQFGGSLPNEPNCSR